MVTAAPDTAGRPIYYTLNKKRVVYGGGGITPDIRITAEMDLTEVQSKLEQSRVFFEFANEYAARNLDKAEWEETRFIRTYEVDDAAVQECIARALQTEGLEITRQELEPEADYVRNAIKRELAGNLWGLNARYQVILRDDPAVAEALQYFGEAQMMAKLYEQAVEN
jgi:carboxyl-terminal processing protease